MDFLNPAQRLKKIRKQLNMKQQDFQEKEMTRSYYGMLENGKRNLSFDTAFKILEKFKRKAEQLCIDLDIDEKYLMMSPMEEAKKYCLDNLEDDINQEKATELINIVKRYNLAEVEAEIYKILGDISYRNKTYNQAFLNYSFSIDIYKNTTNKKNIAYLYNRLGMCKFSVFECNDSVIYFNRAIYYSSIYNDEVTGSYAIYNIAKCYRKLKKYDKAIEYCDIFISECNKSENVENYIYAQSMKANCLGDTEKIDNAILIYNELLREKIEIVAPLKAYVYNNLGSLYFKKEELIKSLNYFNKSQSIRSEVDKKNLSHTLIDKSEVYIKQKLYNEAIMIINLGIDMAKIYKDSQYLLKSYNLLIEIYTLNGDCNKVEENYNNMLIILKDTKDTKNLLKVYLSLCELTFRGNNYEKAYEYLKLSQTTLEICC